MKQITIFLQEAVVKKFSTQELIALNIDNLKSFEDFDQGDEFYSFYLYGCDEANKYWRDSETSYNRRSEETNGKFDNLKYKVSKVINSRNGNKTFVNEHGVKHIKNVTPENLSSNVLIKVDNRSFACVYTREIISLEQLKKIQDELTAML